MDLLLSMDKSANTFIWGSVMVVLLLGTGIYLSLQTNFFAIKKIEYIFKHTLFNMFSKEKSGEGEITPFQAVTTALATTIGTGNIVGVATAIALGGPGAVFWMWVSAFFGMTTKFAEVVLSIVYREKTEDGRYLGGPMYYLKNGMNSKLLAGTFACFAALAAFGIGNMVQANSISTSLKMTFKVDPLISGIVLAIVTAVVILGGLKTIAKVTEKVVPFMAIVYVLGAILVLMANSHEILPSLQSILSGAFTPSAASGGFAGATLRIAMQHGLSRGVFSNEAGLGSASIAHGAAITESPIKQGFWGIFEVFVDSFVICTMTALAILTSRMWTGGTSGAILTTQAFESSLKGAGYLVSISIVFFAFSTLIGWSYYGERGAEYLLGPKVIPYYRILWIPFIIIGATGKLNVLWGISDTLNALMAIPNLIGVISLSGIVIKLQKEYFEDIEGKTETEVEKES